MVVDVRDIDLAVAGSKRGCEEVVVWWLKGKATCCLSFSTTLFVKQGAWAAESLVMFEDHVRAILCIQAILYASQMMLRRINVDIETSLMYCYWGLLAVI